MCLIVSLAILGPRAVIVLWWLTAQNRWELAFDSFIVPFLGFLFLPWTTLMYVVVAPTGVNSFDWLWLALALAADLGSYAGSSGVRRSSQRSAPSGAGN
jgi:hypothetical protein